MKSLKQRILDEKTRNFIIPNIVDFLSIAHMAPWTKYLVAARFEKFDGKSVYFREVFMGIDTQGDERLIEVCPHDLFKAYNDGETINIDATEIQKAFIAAGLVPEPQKPAYQL